ncbi:GIY-YIG nuclease family protein [Candidatus Uhrbacteria bacterium]|nr:GIY-YIG nuclease family protein [Candidatus Uhrbacteria bacterium]
MQNLFFVYILECSDGSYYAGSTNDLEERLKRHNTGEASEWISKRRPIKMIYQ